MATVFIDGSQGTTGLRIERRLRERPGIQLLSPAPDERKDLQARVRLARQADVTILCLPDDASRELVDALGPQEGRVIDASSAHRTDERFVYGFVELKREQARRIAQSRRVSVPGCHAGGCVALARPLVKGGALAADAPLSFTSLTGYSGGGKKMIADYQRLGRDPALGAPRPYALGQQHKHLPEVVRYAGLSVAPVFLPVVVDVYSGMLVCLPLPTGIMRRAFTPEELTDLYRVFYEGQPLIRVLDPNPGTSLDSMKLSGEDGMELFVTGNAERVAAWARFDNLGKGASGAALACLNLMLGRPLTEGLTLWNRKGE